MIDKAKIVVNYLRGLDNKKQPVELPFEIAPKSTETRANWDDARLYCFSLNIDGKSGWRLPTKEELNDIYKSPNDFGKGMYWSSTMCNDGNAWSQYFSDGTQVNKYYKYYGLYHVRAVRDLKDNPQQ